MSAPSGVDVTGIIYQHKLIFEMLPSVFVWLVSGTLFNCTIKGLSIIVNIKLSLQNILFGGGGVKGQKC